MYGVHPAGAAAEEVGSMSTGIRSCAVVDVEEAARILGIGRTLAYRLVREGEWPTPVVRVGRLIKIPLAPLYEYVGAGSAQAV